ncbi:MAG: sigma-54 dependent transcriptional regulator [Myxococcales bacterium]
MTARVLVLDDDAALCDLLAAELSELGYQPVCFNRSQDALDFLVRESFDAVVMDIRMPGRSGIEVCSEVVKTRPDLPVILMSAFGTIDTAVQAIRAGAYDFITKPFEVETLDLALKRAVEHHALHEEVKRLRRVTGDHPGFAGLIGTSKPMAALYDLIERVAPSHASVLVRGESGSGKELIARALHGLSRRGAGPFVALNCAAVPDQLLESELFGHEKGAFTDAKGNRSGLLRQAHGGTLFLDEIGDMSPALQPKLLRALQERRVRPVGGDREVPFDTRIIAATHRDLNAAVASGSFRSDLFFRLNVVSIEVPALRDRGDDVLLLAEHFLTEFAQRDGKPVSEISDDACRRLIGYNWPGNVRELRNCIEHAVALARDSSIEASDLPDYVRGNMANVAQPKVASSEPETAPFLSLFEVERRHVLRVLDAVAGNKSVAARILGIDRKTLHARLARYGRERSDQPPPFPDPSET